MRTKAARPFGQRTGVAASTTDVATGGIVGAGVGAQAPSTCLTPHDVDAHGVPLNAPLRLTSSPTHQPRSWSKDVASRNISNIVVTPEVSHALMSSLKDDASLNKYDMSVTPEVSHVEI